MTTTTTEPPTAATSMWSRAQAVLAERGWHQGHYYDRWHQGRRHNPDEPVPESAPVCLLGALSVVLYGDPDPDHWFLAGGSIGEGELHGDLDDLAERLVDLLDIDPNTVECAQWAVSAWNDDPDRTLTDVYTLLERADQEISVAA